VEWKNKTARAENHDAETGAKPARTTEMGELFDKPRTASFEFCGGVSPVVISR